MFRICEKCKREISPIDEVACPNCNKKYHSWCWESETNCLACHETTTNYVTKDIHTLKKDGPNSSGMIQRNQFVPNDPQTIYYPMKSDKSKTTAGLLCFFLGELGIHRFYVGKVGTGILWLFTAGLLGFGWLIDFIVIICDGFKDSNGLKLS